MQRVQKWTAALHAEKVSFIWVHFFLNPTSIHSNNFSLILNILEPRAVAGRRETKAAHESRAARSDARWPRSSDHLRALLDRQDVLRRGPREPGDRPTSGGDPAERRCAVEPAREASSSRDQFASRIEERGVLRGALRRATHSRQRTINLEKTYALSIFFDCFFLDEYKSFFL